MAQGKQQPKFERNLCNRFRDNCDTDGQRTNVDFMSSADIVKSSELALYRNAKCSVFAPLTA